MDAQSPFSAGPARGVGGRLAQANPHRGFLRRKLGLYWAGCALAGAAGLAMGYGVTKGHEAFFAGQYTAKSARVPPALADAVARAAAGDTGPLKAAIPNHPAAALALLVDAEHAPESMGYRNPLAKLGEKELDQVLRACAPAFPLEGLKEDINRILHLSPHDLIPNNAFLKGSRVLTILEASGDPDAGRLLGSSPEDRKLLARWMALTDGARR